ncbi:MAG TPA: carboxypeptidase-like regulatory domain-containing protein [Trueperaceae bacterium]
MSTSVWQDPANQRESVSKKNHLRRLSATLLAGVVALLLAACGSTPMGIQPTEAGNFVLRYTPADARVVVTEEGFESSSISTLSVTAQANEGVKRYQLAPGSYRVTVSRSGYLTFEDQFEIAEGEAEGQGAELNLQVELEVDPNPPSDPGSVIAPSSLSLRGDPNFSPSSLTPEQRLWYERLRAAMNNPDQTMDPVEMAESDDAYNYGRGLFTHNLSLLLGLRATGDLRFLDEVDRLMQEVRDNLYDGWCGGVDDSISKGRYGTMRGEDGFLNFRRRHDEGSEIYCRDVADLEEGMVHSHIALVMYAYHMNRDLESPSGVDYAERADFWLDYLLDHFEAKWRKRSGTEFPGMDFIDVKFCHTYNAFQMYYYFVGRVLQDQGDSRASAYLAYGREMTDRMFETPYIPDEQGSGFMNTSTPLGEAVVWSFGAPGEDLDPGDASLEACPTTYTRYMVPSLIQLHLEGVYRWDDSILRKIATGLAYFVFDTDDISDRDEPFAAGVTGDEKVEGILPTEYRTRFDENGYAISALANIMPWNDTGRIEDISMQVYEGEEGDLDNPHSVHLPASFLLNSVIDN